MNPPAADPVVMTRVSNLLPGQSARLVAVGGQGTFRRRLLEMGLLPGTLVRLVRKVEVGGVLELEVRGARLSLRLAEARELSAEPCQADRVPRSA
jgi:Fe2+ transport system protein FeoA